MIGHIARNCFTKTRPHPQNRQNFPRRFTRNFRGRQQRQVTQGYQPPRVRFQDQYNPQGQYNPTGQGRDGRRYQPPRNARYRPQTPNPNAYSDLEDDEYYDQSQGNFDRYFKLDKGSQVHLNLLPTQPPLEDILEVPNSSQEHSTEILVLDNEPYNLYQSRNPHLIESQQLSDTSDIDVNLLSCDIDELDTPYNSNRTIFVHTDSNESNLYLAQPRDKVKKTWYNQMSKSELNVDPKFATDNTCYEMEATLQNIASNVIQATYLGPVENNSTGPTLFLDPGSRVQSQLPSGLQLTTLIDTGCHKTILNRKFLKQHLYHFQNFKKVLLKEDHKIRLANGLVIKTDGLIAMPLIIQGYLFQFLVLVTTLADDFDFVLGLEALVQMESTYSLRNNTLQFENRCIPLYPLTDTVIPPKSQNVIQLTGHVTPHFLFRLCSCTCFATAQYTFYYNHRNRIS